MKTYLTANVCALASEQTRKSVPPGGAHGPSLLRGLGTVVMPPRAAPLGHGPVNILSPAVSAHTSTHTEITLSRLPPQSL